ncbi:hypothetical protein SKAU_G00015890 [Synaphobranchus kaupii]|uniref:BZIP domain-containing protein n=1 Tax=Synaphobranchus kaupii TaxID=118154 RepID=A0A9Q1GC44_SYNKA|nr:hypothetical protein SKAU_G00015890 [Synaphobranchus kaupii]
MPQKATHEDARLLSCPYEARHSQLKSLFSSEALHMSVVEELPEMDGADLLGLLFHGESAGADDPFFPDGSALMEDLFSEQDMFSGVDTEDFLSSLLGEGDGAPCLLHSPLGSDSGISDDSGNNNACHSPGASDSDPVPSPSLLTEIQLEAAEAVQTDHCYSLQQQDVSDALQSVRSEKPDTDVFIDLEDWDSSDMMEDPSDEVPPCTLAIEDIPQCNSQNQFLFQEIVLTDEERRLLAKEGSSLPAHLPLTKAEERTLKRVRRKIRNKQSAQESRKKKKVYVDGLENRVAVCTAHNLELQKKVQLLQKQNMSLIEQLRKLQALMKLSTMKTTTTSTCVMVFLLSFCLIIFPSVNPFGSSGGQKELYAPSGVLSRTLRSVSIPDVVEGVSSKEWADDEEPLLLAKVENSKAMFSGNQNHTPDYQHVERPDSESGVNSNSSSDFPNPGSAEMKPAAGGVAEGPRGGSVAQVDYQVTGTNENWIDRKPTSVIIQQHRSDEM